MRYEVTPQDFSVAAATADEVAAWLERIRPKQPQTPPRDLTATEIRDLDELGHGDVQRVGAKAANVAELRRMLPAGVAPDGYAIPFSFYDRHMREGGFYERAAQLACDPELQADPAKREEALDDLRKAIKKADAARARRSGDRRAAGALRRGTGDPLSLVDEQRGPRGVQRCGAVRLVHAPPRRGQARTKTIKQVWASLWNFRAFDEREFHRIDHLGAAMGVLVHPNFDDELANGVAVTKNPYDPNWPGFYVNVQVGESLVTNPDPNATPDELLISAIGEHGEYETQYIRHSTLTENGAPVMTPPQIKGLTLLLETIQERFKVIYGRQDDDAFAMDVEFKVDAAGNLAVKQARPWVE